LIGCHFFPDGVLPGGLFGRFPYFSLDFFITAGQLLNLLFDYRIQFKSQLNNNFLVPINN